MNIFILDTDPIKSAKYLCNKHILKMIIESCQLLCSVFYFNNRLTDENCDFVPKIPYKLTHKNHPCAIWARKSEGNFNWLLSHAIAISDEYTVRYGKVHGCKKVIDWILSNKVFLKFPMKEMTEFVQVMPDRYKDKDPVLAYKKYYVGEKLLIAKYPKGRMPEFIEDELTGRNHLIKYESSIKDFVEM